MGVLALAVSLALYWFSIPKLSDCKNSNFRLWFCLFLIGGVIGAVGVFVLLYRM